MHIQNVKNKIRESYINKFYRVYNNFKNQEDIVQMEILINLTPEARDLLQYGLIDNSYVKSYDKKRFDYLKDNRSTLELAFGFLTNEIIEVMTKVYFQKDLVRLEYYNEATRNNSSKANSYADFVLFYNHKQIYVELETYLSKTPKDGFIIKETKFKALMKMYREGKSTILLNKYILNDRIFYVYYNFNEIIQKDLYKKGYKLAGKDAVKITAPGIEINTINAF